MAEAERDQARLAEVAAAEAFRRRLRNSEDKLTAMSLALEEEERKKAEEVLAKLAAAETAAEDEEAEVVIASLGKEERSVSRERTRSVALLNRQILELREQLNELQGLLDAASAKDAEAQVEIASLGKDLNQALARAAAEQKKRADLEERERRRLEAEAQDLRRFRSRVPGPASGCARRPRGCAHSRGPFRVFIGDPVRGGLGRSRGYGEGRDPPGLRRSSGMSRGRSRPKLTGFCGLTATRTRRRFGRTNSSMTTGT